MSLIPNPRSVFLREPNLLTPWRKPVGSVKIDHSHGIGGNVRHCSLDAKRDIASNGAPLEVLSDVVEERGVIAGSQYFRNTSTATTIRNGWVFADSYSEFFGSNSRSFIIFGISSAWTAGGHIISYGDPASTQRYTLRLDTGGVLRFEIQGSSYVSSIAPPTDTHVLIGISTGSTYNDSFLYANGIAESMSGATTINTGSTRNVSILNGVKTAVLIVNTFYIFGFYAINRKLTVAEMDDLYDDPYQFLIPA